SASAALCLFRTSELDTVLVRGASGVGVELNSAVGGEIGVEIKDKQLLRRFSQAISAALPKYPTDVAFAPAGEMLERRSPPRWDGPTAPWSGWPAPRANSSACFVSPTAAPRPPSKITSCCAPSPGTPASH